MIPTGYPRFWLRLAYLGGPDRARESRDLVDERRWIDRLDEVDGKAGAQRGCAYVSYAVYATAGVGRSRSAGVDEPR
jgi:hypothetical protein